jgi:hypothetical protein
MEINKKQFKKWIKALDSGEYKQGNGALNNKNEFCCLGVACKVLIPKSKIKLDEYNDIDGAFPVEQKHSPKWLKNVNDDFEYKTTESLSKLNDDHDFSFPEIATMLELVYIHKALK